MTQRLWALDGHLLTDPTAQATLTTSLQRLSQVAHLHLVLIKRGHQARSYLATEGCPGCLHGRCEVGCRTDLLTRVLRQTAPQVTLRHVPLGLIARPYARRWLAWPTTAAQPLTADLLTGMAEARLILHWQPPLLPRQPATLCALLLTGADSADGAARLRTCGWQVVTLPAWLPWFRATAGLPPTLPPGRTPPFPPTLLVPYPIADRPIAESGPSIPDTPDQEVPHPDPSESAATPVSAITYRLSAMETTWEPLPDPFLGALDDIAQETAAERQAVVAVADADEIAAVSAPNPDAPAALPRKPPPPPPVRTGAI